LNGPVPQIQDAAIGLGSRNYLALVAGIVGLLLAACALLLGRQGGDHFAALTRNGKAFWYQDLAGDYVTEIQDQDLFYHNIGRSIDYARRADIVILGSSLVSFALNEEVIRERLEEPRGLKFYNMAFVGISSSEFSRRIIEKYGLHPRLWIINADDGGGGGNFFSRNLMRSFGADVKSISASQHGRARAYYDVIRRNLRWRLEDATAEARSGLFPANAAKTVIPKFYRSDETGAADMSFFPHLLANDNPRVRMTRDPDCHTTPEVIAAARDFVRALGSQVVLTLVPNFHGCLTQVREIADAIGVEVVLPPRTDYSSWDNGGHLDRIGSAEFTSDLVNALEKTAVFQALGRTDAR
jgi:ketosteroid isomerase-like protein